MQTQLRQNDEIGGRQRDLGYHPDWKMKAPPKTRYAAARTQQAFRCFRTFSRRSSMLSFPLIPRQACAKAETSVMGKAHAALPILFASVYRRFRAFCNCRAVLRRAGLTFGYRRPNRTERRLRNQNYPRPHSGQEAVFIGAHPGPAQARAPPCGRLTRRQRLW